MAGWTPTFLDQLAAPRASVIHAASLEGNRPLHLFDPDRESLAVPLAHESATRALVSAADTSSPDVTEVQHHIA
ncbi:hypothetical protein ACWD5V_41945 [Streptomyces sp. NPDC002523]